MVVAGNRRRPLVAGRLLGGGPRLVAARHHVQLHATAIDGHDGHRCPGTVPVRMEQRLVHGGGRIRSRVVDWYPLAVAWC